MTTFAARTIGPLIDLLDCDGVVSGVFDQTFNIQLSNRSLVTCASSSYFNMPRGIRIGSTENCPFISYVQGGTPAHCRRGIIRFSESDLKIDLRSAHIWLPEFEPIARPESFMLVGFLVDLLTDSNSELSYGYDLLRKDPVLAVSKLIGRGRGLTPEGDDMLAGYMAALVLVAPENPLSVIMVQEILQSAWATTDISRQMLVDATHGHFIEPVVNLMSALYGNGNVKKAIKHLKTVGSSSGTAMTLGVLAGVAQIENYSLDLNPNRIIAT